MAFPGRIFRCLAVWWALCPVEVSTLSGSGVSRPSGRVVRKPWRPPPRAAPPAAAGRQPRPEDEDTTRRQSVWADGREEEKEEECTEDEAGGLGEGFLLSNDLFGGALGLHRVLLRLRRELPQTALEPGSPGLYAPDVALLLAAPSGEAADAVAVCRGREDYAALESGLAAAAAASAALAGLAGQASPPPASPAAAVEVERCDLWLDDAALAAALRGSGGSGGGGGGQSPGVRLVADWCVA